jgi:hypothetical protein
MVNFLTVNTPNPFRSVVSDGWIDLKIESVR